MRAVRPDRLAAAQWDIPVLPLSPEARARLYRAAFDRAESSGFVLPLAAGGAFLAWSDRRESGLFGWHALRIWAAAPGGVGLGDLDALCTRLEGVGARFAALSAWRELPAHPAFLDVGSSEHLLLEHVRSKARPPSNLEVRALGGVPGDWVAAITDHAVATPWQDRQALDPYLPRARVERRRREWVEACLRSGDGFLAVSLDPEGALVAYLLLPFDRSRVAFGGPVLGGVNALLGRIGPGRSQAHALIHFVHHHAIYGLAGAWIIQYQGANVPIQRLARDFLVGPSCTRHDRHWHADSG